MTTPNNYECREIGELEWEVHWPKVVKSNLMQSWEYGDAKSISEGWKPVRYLWEDAIGKPVALAQVLTKSFSIFGGIARLNRGPLLISYENFSSDTSVKLELISTLKKIARLKRWWVFFMAPEILSIDTSESSLKLNHLNVRQNVCPWASTRLSLKVDQSGLMATLNGKWRGHLRKAFANKVNVIEVALTSETIDELISFYDNAQKGIGFSGISPALLRRLCAASGSDWKLCYYAVRNESTAELCGILVSVIHGDTATYLIGNTNADGRRMQANYAMLWEAIIDAKTYGCGWYDLGGLNENTPRGVADFKSGLNGGSYKLIGEIVTFPMFRSTNNS